MELTELERTVIEQAKIEAVRICVKNTSLLDSLNEMESLYGLCEDEHFLWFVDFFIRTHRLDASVDSFKSSRTKIVHGAVMAIYNPKPPNNGSPSTTGEAGSR